MQRRGSGSQLAAKIFPEVFSAYVRQIDFSECHRPAISYRLGRRIGLVNKNAHPLIACAMGIDRSSLLSRGLDLDSFGAGLDAIAGIDSGDDYFKKPISLITLGSY